MPVDFPERNFIYTKPEGMTAEQCSDLPVWRGPTKLEADGSHVNIIVSKWKLNKEDLEEVQKTGCIYLSITTLQQPPVSLFTENPFE